ncbi:MAG: hypothetical protein M3Y77_22535 [Actinomycetota bacterium]|nr:hypothetical protein [Actinomycetota bacterium]
MTHQHSDQPPTSDPKDRVHSDPADSAPTKRDVKDPPAVAHPTGTEQARENAENELPG